MVLDILKPIEPYLMELGKRISELKGVEAVDLSVKEVDRKVETVRMTIEGEWLEFDKINSILEKYGAVVHSIDRITVGNRLTSPD